MPAVEPGKIRNVAVVGHRGTGKTSLVEAMLFQAGATNRLGVIEQGTTVSDWDEDEQHRQMSIADTLCHLEWHERKINLIDTPGEPSFQGDAIAALHVVEGALVTVSGVMGVEVQTTRNWNRAEELGLARVIFVNMLDRERADFFRVLEQMRSHFGTQAVAVHLPIGIEHELSGVVDVLHMTAYTSPEGDREAKPGEIPAEMSDQVEQYRTQLLDSVVETDEALMERYLDGQELSPEEVASALKSAVTRGELFPVMCGVATKNLGTTAVLDLLVEGVPSPAKKGSRIEVEGASDAAFVFKTVADPFAGRINVFRVLKGAVSSDATLANVRTHGKERVGALLTLQGKEHESADVFGEGDLGAVAKLKDVMTGDLLLDSDQQVELPSLDFPEPVMSFAITPEGEGRRGEGRDVAPAPQRGGPDAPAPPRPADRRAARVGDDPDARRGRGRPAQAPLRRRGRPQPAARPVPRDDPQGVARATAATRSRPAAAGSSATRTSCWSRSRAAPATSSSTRSSAASSRRASGRRSTRASRRRWCRES